MRTIKFRGKEIDTDEWLYGDLFQPIGHFPMIVHIEPSVEGKALFAKTAVKRETVGQFTGLFDKNGKEIYEGDIYRFGNVDSLNEVSYSIGGGFSGFDFSPARHDENRLTDIEVIGNIYDNPELLKGGE